MHRGGVINRQASDNARAAYNSFQINVWQVRTVRAYPWLYHALTLPPPRGVTFTNISGSP